MSQSWSAVVCIFATPQQPAINDDAILCRHLTDPPLHSFHQLYSIRMMARHADEHENVRK
jgi:hypothetical protein